jgi:hypothetical protein
MTMKWIALPTMAMAVCLLGSSPSRAYSATSQEPGYEHHDEGGWDQPPAEFRDVKRQGFHDGIEAARKDFDHHRRPDVDRRDEYRHPHVDPAMREDYREGFRRGYETAMHHMMDHDDHPDYH